MKCYIVTQHGQRIVQATGTPLWLPGPTKLRDGYAGLTVPADITPSRVKRFSQLGSKTVYLEVRDGKVIVRATPQPGFVTAKLPTKTLKALAAKIGSTA